MRHKASPLTIALATLALAACNGTPSTSNPPAATGASAPPTPASTTAPPATAHSAAAAPASQGSTMDDLKAFATNGARIMDSLTGDLNNDGRPDALLVLDPPSDSSQKLGEGAPRTVLLLIRGEDGKLHEAASNQKVVPCATGGGVSGDPYGFVRLESGQFTVRNGGGSREHWSDEFTFKYSADRKDWLLDKATRSVVDQDTDKHKTLELTPKDFGDIAFKDFDPAKLPEAELP